MKKSIPLRRFAGFGCLLRRRGMAPLEFILALPLLLILTYLSFIVFVTFVEKFHGVTLVREATFEKVDFARPTEILKLSANPFNGETHSEFEHLLDWNSTNLKFDVQATLFANGGTWDHDTVPFASPPQVPQIHLQPAIELLSAVGVSNAIHAVASEFSHQMNFGLPPFVTAAMSGETLNRLVDLSTPIIRASVLPVKMAKQQMQYFLSVTPAWRFRPLRQLARQGIQLVDMAESALSELPRAADGWEISAP